MVEFQGGPKIPNGDVRRVGWHSAWDERATVEETGGSLDATEPACWKRDRSAVPNDSDQREE